MIVRPTRARPLLPKAALCVAITSALAGPGCAIRAINAEHYQFHFDAGVTALDNRNFQGAARQFGFAYWYATTGFLGPKMEAAAAYNCGLAVGQLGDFRKAEENLKTAIDLDKKSEGEDGPHAGMRLFELARLYQAERNYELSAVYYSRGCAWIERHAEGVKKDPIALALVLLDYASVLDRIGDGEKAELLRKQAERIRTEHPGTSARIKILYYPGDPFHSPGNDPEPAPGSR